MDVFNVTDLQGHKITDEEILDYIKKVRFSLTDIKYVVFQGHVDAEVPKAYQEYCTRHVPGSIVKSDAERQRVIQCIEYAIERRVSEDYESFGL